MPLDEAPQLDLIRQNGDDTPVTRIALPKRRHRRSPENGKMHGGDHMPAELQILFRDRKPETTRGAEQEKTFFRW